MLQNTPTQDALSWNCDLEYGVFVGEKRFGGLTRSAQVDAKLETAAPPLSAFVGNVNIDDEISVRQWIGKNVGNIAYFRNDSERDIVDCCLFGHRPDVQSHPPECFVRTVARRIIAVQM